MGLQLRWLERTPDKREVGGSTPPKPTEGSGCVLCRGECVTVSVQVEVFHDRESRYAGQAVPVRFNSSQAHFSFFTGRFGWWEVEWPIALVEGGRMFWGYSSAG